MAAANNSNTTGGGGSPNLPPMNPFFTVPDLSADGDFEVLGVNVHHNSLPPPNTFFALPDIGVGGNFEMLGTAAQGKLFPAPVLHFSASTGQQGDGDYHSDIGADTDMNDMANLSDTPKVDGGGGGGGNGGGTGNGNTGGDDDGSGADFNGMYDQDASDRKKNPTPTVDSDAGGGYDNEGTSDNNGGDTSTRADHVLPPQADGDNGAGGDFGGMYNDGPPGDYSDRDNGAGGDNNNNIDGGDVSVIASKDNDQSSGFGSDYWSYDAGDAVVQPTDNDSNWGIGADGGFSDGLDQIGKDQDNDQGDVFGGIGSADGNKGDPNVPKGDADAAGGCENSFSLFTHHTPAGGTSAAVGLIFAMGLLKAIPQIILLPFFGEAEAESMLFQALNIIGTILKTAGVPEPAVVAIEAYLSAIGIPTSPLDILNAGDLAAGALQPALTSIQNQNSITALQNFAAQNNGCLPAKCANIWSNLIAADGTTFNICQDGVGGSDSGDGSITIGDGNALGTLAGTRVAGSSLTPVSTLAIPSIRSIGNKLTVSLNQFLIR